MHAQEQATRKKFNFLKKYYDKTWDEAGHTLHVGMFRRGNDTLPEAYANATQYLIEKVSARAPITTASTVLDVGCGTGRTIIDLCTTFECAGVGVDLSDAQIADARAQLRRVNADRVKRGKRKLRVRFVRASGSELAKQFTQNERFTHVISQDAIMLVADKQSLFENLYRLLAPGGVLAVADFLSESSARHRTKKEQKLVFSLVNWTGELSQDAYLRVLETVGFSDIESARHDADMIRTYQVLADKMEQYLNKSDSTYADLKARYEMIVATVKRGKMGWGFFFARKPARKTVLLAGTKAHSIARVVGKALHAQGWDVWLYSRHAKRINRVQWHERKCDITSERSIAALLREIPHVDLVMMTADTGGHGALSEVSAASVQGMVNAKIVGSVLLAKALEAKYGASVATPIQLVWCAGKTTSKPKDLIAYGIVNTGLTAYVDALNTHYAHIFKAYYLPTGLTSPSTLGDEYIAAHGKHLKSIARPPQVIVDEVQRIVDGDVPPGVVDHVAKAVL